MNKEYWIEKLNLFPHPEGGFYKETYRSASVIPKGTMQPFTQERNVSTAIYFLLPSGHISALHKILSDELWFFHCGTSLLIYSIDKENGVNTHRLGLDIEKGDMPYRMIPANSWFGAEVEAENSYSLVSCTVAPGFDFNDFELGNREFLIKEFPDHQNFIHRLTHQEI